MRGLTEGFYGTPWTREQRLAQLDFMGRTKQNRYVYAPGDDPYRQARWREPYPAGQRADFRALAERARAQPCDAAWAVAPGQAMCMASDGDVQTLTRKLDAMWALGVRSFQLQFQDVSYSEWHCDEDADAFGSGPEAAAKAQARVADAVAAHLRDRHRARGRVSLMPTEYFQAAPPSTARRSREASTRVAGGVDRGGGRPADHHRARTGRCARGVGASADDDGQLPGQRLRAGPYLPGPLHRPRARRRHRLGGAPRQRDGAAGRLPHPALHGRRLRLESQALPPQESWRAAIDDLAGPDAKAREAVAALAGNDASSVLGGEESAYLRPLIDDFWRARESADQGRLSEAAQRLRAAFTVHAGGPPAPRGQ